MLGVARHKDLVEVIALAPEAGRLVQLALVVASALGGLVGQVAHRPLSSCMERPVCQEARVLG